MRYLSWGAFYEGGSDALYFDVILPRIIRDLVTTSGIDLVEVPDVPAVRLGKFDRSIASVAAEACAFRDAFHILFIHADTGGRGLEQGLADRSEAYCTAIHQTCRWPLSCCVTITPRHETEAWVLADGSAVTAALGYNGPPEQVGLPADARSAERLEDPKRVLDNAIEAITGRRRRHPTGNLFSAIGQRQDLNALRLSTTFTAFENKLRSCLQELRLIR